MTYPQWWERLVAGIIDGLIVGIPWLVIHLLLTIIARGSFALTVIMLLLSALILAGGTIAYKVMMESSPRQATFGKIVFGLQVVDGAGNRISRAQAFVRTWPWWVSGAMVFFSILGIVGLILNLLLTIGLIAVFVMFFMPPVGRCLHDQTANCNVIKTSQGMLAQT